MSEITDISIGNSFDLNTGHHSVVQKGDDGSKYVYALQLRDNAADTYVLRGYAGNVTTPVVTMYGSAGGHTQTWEYSGESGKWFVGTKPSSTSSTPWDKQIARVNIRPIGKYYSYNTQLPRLAYLNRAGASTYDGDDLYRAEAALSPDYSKFLLATIDNNGNGYFTIYDANTINNELDNVEYDNGYVNLGDLGYEESFVVSDFVDTVSSIQGYDIDNNGNIYISSQLPPDVLGESYHKKNIFKIPTYARTDTSNWLQVDLTDNAGPINIYGQGMHTELEGLQILDENNCYLTVAYHKDISGSNKTVWNRIFQVQWNG